MDPNPQDITLDENIKQAIHALPAPIRDYLGQGAYSPVVRSLMAKYGLRIDQGGVLERETMLLLMGVETPDAFVTALAEEAKLDKEVINNITREVNEQIFVPLRAQMQGGGVSEPSPLKPALPTPRPVDLPPPSVIIPANPSMPMRAQPHEYITKVAPTYAPPRPPAPRPAAPTPSKPLPMPMPTAKLLEDHEEPSPSLGAVIRAVTQPALAKPSERGYALPATPPSPPAKELNILRRPSVSNTPPPPILLTPKPPLQSYGADPYHEPIDDSLQDT